MAEDRRARFIIVGLANTALDFAILFLLTSFDMPVFLANVISTGVAFIFSFVANRSFTFRADGDARKQILKFAVVTLVGLWLLQPAVIWALTALLAEAITQPLALLIGKAGATVVSMLWNYILYARFVFPPAARSAEVLE